MIPNDRLSGDVRGIERTLKEEIEISELSQLVSVFDDEEEAAKRDYKEAKRELIKRINSLKKIEIKTTSTLIYQNTRLNVDNLLKALEKLELQIKNSALAIEEVDNYVFDEKRKKKVFRTEYFIKERGGSSRNSEEERLLKFLNQKVEMANELKLFAECFNELDEMKRELLYYSFFKEDSDNILIERLDYSQTSVTRLKREATIQLMDTLMLREVENWNAFGNCFDN